MIKFFRHIRQSLINQNKMGKYFKYAIGEILLVVIGILIAIQINAYYTHKDTIKITTNQLKNVALELEENIILLNKTIEKSSDIVNSSRTITNIIVEQTEVPSKQLSELLGSAFAPVLNYQPNSEMLNEMIVSGALRNLKNKELKLMLLEFQAKLARIKNQELLHAEDQERCTEYLLKFGDFKAIMDDTNVSKDVLNLAESKVIKGNQALMNSKEFENRVILFMASGIGLENGMYQPFKTYLQMMLNTIETELESND